MQKTWITGEKTTNKLHVSKIEKKIEKKGKKKLNKSRKQCTNILIIRNKLEKSEKLKDEIFIYFLVECVFFFNL